ncbi:MAG TPA: exopolysaccharide biosynthesis polyprenyl glycosylphosphotransferase, partial [Longimicrobiaceae bacterium]
MSMSLFEAPLPLQAEGRERASPRLRLLRPSPRVRWDSPILIELFRFTDVSLALLVLLGELVLLSPAADPGSGALGAVTLGAGDVLLLGLFVAWWHTAYALLGMYGTRRIGRRSDELVAVAVSSALGASILLPYALLDGSAVGLDGVLLVWAASTLLVIASRRWLRTLWTSSVRGRGRQILIVGSGPRARDLLEDLGHGNSGDRVVGHLDAGDPHGPLTVPFLGGLDQLEPVLMRTAVDAVLIALPIRSCYAEVQRTIEVCERVGVIAEYPADVFRFDRGEPQLDPSGARAVMTLGVASADGGQRVKRALDVFGAAAGLVLLAPLLLLIALAVRLSGPGPVLFVQRRCGRNRRVFPMYKFRTMVSNAEALQAELEHLNEAGGPVFKIRLDPRVTPLGRFLRRTSLDELPQLLNVLFGDMSLVGPRPLPLRDVHRFSAPASLRRFSVRPGMTCLWQVNGRSDLGFDDWLRMDLQYIDRWSLLL